MNVKQNLVSTLYKNEGGAGVGDLIAAISTAPGKAAIGILRLTGKGAVEAINSVFRPEWGKSMAERGDRQLVYGTLLDKEGRPIDKALATISRGPSSYTGEDTGELHCHGSPLVLSMGLEALCHAGARQAGPGEFTRRAFLNGRLDLLQAEGVGDLLDATSATAVRGAVSQLAGSLSVQVERVYQSLVDLMAHFHAVLDYPDEDIDPFSAKIIDKTLATAVSELGRLLKGYERGKHMVRGVPCVLLGKPNAGKSSLLNALLGYSRAIVTHIPGTTRDTVEESVQVGQVLLRLVDTAGLREGGDEVEQLGIARSREAAQAAALALYVTDRSTPPGEEDEQALALASACPQMLAVVNKRDLPPAPGWDKLLGDLPKVEVSALTGEGMSQLEDAVAELFPPGVEGEALLTNARQAEAATRALEGVTAAREGLAQGITPDAVLTDVEGAMHALAQLTGREIREDVVARIFSRFCVGK